MNKPIHVLIVDDDPDDTDFLTGAFTTHFPDTRFTTCRNGQQALEFLYSSARAGDCPDIVFLDLHMPGKNGYQVLTELRASADCRDFPVMVISTSMMESEAEKCRQAGCNGYFSKPVSLAGYDDIVQSAIDYLHSGTG